GMQTKRKNWPYIVVGVVAAAIPLSALIMEPPGAADASPVLQEEPGILRQTDELGYTWILQQAGEPSMLSFRKPGSPITVKTNVRKTDSGVVLIGLVLEGRAGETYRPAAIKNRVPVDPPWLRIVDEQGNVLDEGRFAFG
ncbi:MAG: hypothetical protein ACM3VT_05635, partial [Solirubrobacterales bacterium]